MFLFRVSGLDSYMAETVVHELKRMAESGRTIISTIHQPPSPVFDMFSHLCLMANGRCVYLGPIQDAVNYFSTLGFDCPPYHNPSDFFIDAISNNAAAEGGDAVEASRAEYEKKVNIFATSYSYSALGRKVSYWRYDAAQRGALVSSMDIESLGATKKEFRSSPKDQFLTLYNRANLYYTREPVLVKARLGQTIVMGIFIGLMYLGLGYTQRDVQVKPFDVSRCESISLTFRARIVWDLCLSLLSTSALWDLLVCFKRSRSSCLSSFEKFPARPTASICTSYQECWLKLHSK